MLSLAIFLLFFTATLGIGGRITHALFRDDHEGLSSEVLWTLKLALGSAFWAVLLGIATSIRFPADHWMLVLIAGFGVAGLLWTTQLQRLRIQRGFASGLFFSLCIVHLGLKLIEGFQLHSHGDAYIAYLAAPRMAWMSGNWESLKTNPYLFLSSSWESFSSIGIWLLRGTDWLDTLVQCQRFAQWCTGIFANLGIALATAAWLGRWGLDRTAWIGAFVALSIPHLRWTANLAKHDLGVAFWALSGLVLMDVARNQLGRFFAGALLGIACIGKPTLGAPLLAYAALLLLLLPEWRHRSRWGWVIAGGLVGAMPWLIRNFYAAKNPIYPFASTFFGSNWAGPMVSSMGSHASSFELTSLGTQWIFFREYLEQFPISWIAPLPFVLWWIRATGPRKKFIALLPPVSIVFFDLLMRRQSEIRYNSIGLIWWNGLTACLTLEMLLNWQPVAPKILLRLRSMALLSLPLALVMTSNLSLHTLLKAVQGRLMISDAAQLLRHHGGPAKDWIRAHITKDHLLATVGDKQIYYLLGTNLIPVESEPRLERRLLAHWAATSQNPVDRLAGSLKILSEAGATHLYVDKLSCTYPEADICFPEGDQLNSLLSGKCLVFWDTHSAIVDLRCALDAGK